ncbi:MAG TPA: hypothetical protein PLY90_06315 [Candidatus Hydrogenedentes bacterium]|nr:hypothetical protein [Candidatus Hydrogenedentota bacterium]
MSALRFFFPLFMVVGLIMTQVSATEFKAGFAKKDITPQAPLPMWGYGARHDIKASATRDPLFAKVLVIEAGGERAALIGLDLGRSPTAAMMKIIEEGAKEKAGVSYILAVGSHTHHGPVIELLDEPGMGQGKFDDAVKYAEQLPAVLLEAIEEAAASLQDARIGLAVEDTDLNRNRHTKKLPKPIDPRLSVLRIDDLSGNCLAVMINLAAHATIESVFNLHWTSEWPGHMQKQVEDELGCACFFMQGAAGDMSPNTSDTRKGIDGFGKAAAEKAIELTKTIQTTVPETPSIAGRTDYFTGPSRIDLSNRLVLGALKQGFFPELLALTVEMPDNQVTVRMDTLVLNKQFAFVGASGELFSDLSNRIKARSPLRDTLVFGYCNGHSMYIPTREGIEEGGYGADPLVAWCPEGTGEAIVEKAVENIEALVAAQ